MMATCLGKSLTADATAKLLTFCTNYTFNGVEYVPLMYKIIMQIATINTVGTTKTLRDNLNNLGVFAATIQGNIHKINGKFDKNYTQLFARGATVSDPVGLLFNAYLIVPCHKFKGYMKQYHNEYLDDRHSGLTHKRLMTYAVSKFSCLQQKGQWGGRSPNNEKIIVMAAQIEALKRHLKAGKHLEDALNNNKTTHNKKNRGDKNRQKEDEAWKKVPPKDGDKKSKEMGKNTYHWCMRHIAWCMHLPTKCRIGLQHV
jgi:hypothetical protein